MPILLTPGEPAGIGPDITISVAQHDWPKALVAVADPILLQERAAQLQMPIRIIEVQNLFDLMPQEKHTLYVLPVKLKQSVVPGSLNLANAAYVIETLEIATKLCMDNTAEAVVTGPVHKAVINDAGIAFSGHTEFFAKMAGVKNTVMLFVVDEMKVALVTTHLPLANVPSAITHEKLTQVIDTLLVGFKNHFKLENPRILVCGLNPHAGENGHLGREEITTIEPVVQYYQQKNMAIKGPYPADTIFTANFLKQADVILAMYHDQALPVVKYKGFSHAVNMTLGLPFLRTSVDHGTALNIAGTGQAEPGSMFAAIELAAKLIN